ncbi:MAG: TolC family protein [Rikenellaceae bacterium]|nr:TolC family protein [Rikenellaceae bacterium]
MKILLIWTHTKLTIVAVIAGCCPLLVGAKPVTLTLAQAINRAQSHSIDAMMAKHTYLSQYWQYRSYKAQRLPSLSLSGTIPNFDKSYTSLQNAVTGGYNYVDNYAMRNSLGLYLQQNIAATGGNIQLYTGLDRLDQFSPNREVTWNSAPVSLILNQPIGGFNQLKWDKKIEPVRYEKAKYEYLESMESITANAVTLFFNLLIAQQNLDIARQNYANTDTLYKISLERFKIGSISKNDLMQLELRLLNEGMSINSNKLQLDLAAAKLKSYLMYDEQDSVVLDIPENIADIEISIDEAYRLAFTNTSFEYRNRIGQLEAEMSVAQAKANRRPQATVYARFGLNQVANTIGDAYRNPLDQETIRMGISVPIFDGGVAKGKVRMALSRQEVTEAEIDKDRIDRKQDIYLKVMQFNNQNTQCSISAKADSVAAERYNLSLRQFAAGKISVLDFNTAQSERNTAHTSYLAELQNYWNYYYTIQRYTLFDFLHMRNIANSFDAASLEK